MNEYGFGITLEDIDSHLVKDELKSQISKYDINRIIDQKNSNINDGFAEELIRDFSSEDK